MNGSKNILSEANKIINNAKTLKGNIKRVQMTDKNISKLMDQLFDETYEFNKFYTLCGLYQIIETEQPMVNMWKTIDTKLHKYISDINKDREYYDKLLLIKNHISSTTKNSAHIIFLTNILQSMNKYGLNFLDNTKLTKIVSYYTIISNKIINKINTGHKVKIGRNSINALSDINTYSTVPTSNNTHFNLIINPYTYQYIISKMDKKTNRNNIYMLYNNISIDVINEFAKVVISKHEVAKRMGYKTYGEMVNKNEKNNFIYYTEQSNVNIIRDFLRIIIQETEKKNIEIINTIKQDTNKITDADVIHHINKQKNALKFVPNIVISKLIDVIDKYFGLRMVLSSDKEFGEGDLCFNAVNDKNVAVGNIHIILSSKKNIHPYPLVFIINDKCVYKGSITNPNITITINCDTANLSSPVFSISDISHLFRQFGNILSHITSNSMCCEFNNTDDIMQNLMEFIMWEHMEEMANSSKQIMAIFKMDKMYNLRNTTITALFDNFIYSSDEFVSLCHELTKDENNLDKHLIELYYKLYDGLMNNFNTIYSYNKSSINPYTISKLLGKYSGRLYVNVFSEIASFNIFKFIGASRERAIKFREQVLSAVDNDFRHNLNNLFANEKTEYDIMNHNVYIKFLSH